LVIIFVLNGHRVCRKATGMNLPVCGILSKPQTGKVVSAEIYFNGVAGLVLSTLK
jgi:hypothetical protein